MSRPRMQDIAHHTAHIFLVTKSGKIIGQLRDDIPTIDNPGKIGTFGGAMDPGEDPLEAAWRELVLEETNLKLDKSAVQHLLDDTVWRTRTREWETRHFYYAVVDEAVLENMEVYEGQDWAYMDDNSIVIDAWQPVVSYLQSLLRVEAPV